MLMSLKRRYAFVIKYRIIQHTFMISAQRIGGLVLEDFKCSWILLFSNNIIHFCESGEGDSLVIFKDVINS